VHGARSSVVVDIDRLIAAFSDRHVEIMRDELSEIFLDATRSDVEYLFGDSMPRSPKMPTV